MTFSELNPGELSYIGESSISTSSDIGNGNDTQVFLTSVTQSVMFSLGLNEVVDISLQGSFSLESAVLASGVSWNLSGPSGDVWTPQNFTSLAGASVGNSGTINEAVTGLTGAGVYTLTLTTSVTGATDLKIPDLGSASFSSVVFSVTPIPEPSGYVILMSSVAVMSLFRRR